MRGVLRWLVRLAVVAMAIVLCAFTLHRALTPARFLVRLSDTALPGDGFSSTELDIRSTNGRHLHNLQVQVENRHGAALESVSIQGGSATAVLRAGVLPGMTKLRITAAGFTPQEITLQTTLDVGDTIGDGTPDFLRLHDPADRASFRRWFTLLAESQYFLGRKLPAEIDDCAALLRFAYREALREHNTAWAHTMSLPVPGSAADVQQYQYPYTPLAAALFRVRGGSFEAGNLRDGTFAQFADVENIRRYNTFFVGRDFSQIRPGDLLFFRQYSQKMRFHAMIFVGRSPTDPSTEQFVVYHTGPNGNSRGEIRRWSVAELMNYPEPRWRPILSNPGFLGIYRWNILRGAD